jgi:hypothetical protein
VCVVTWLMPPAQRRDRGPRRMHNVRAKALILLNLSQRPVALPPPRKTRSRACVPELTTMIPICGKARLGDRSVTREDRLAFDLPAPDQHYGAIMSGPAEPDVVRRIWHHVVLHPLSGSLRAIKGAGCASNRAI